MGVGGLVNFKFQSPVEGGSEKLKKGWKFGVGAGLLKRRGLALFLFIFFSRFIIFMEITLLFAKLCYAFEEKNSFSATIIL